MKIFALSLAALFVSATLASADWVLVQSFTGAGQDAQITTKIQGDKARVDMGGKMTMILGADGMTMLMHEQKMVVKKDLASLKAAVEAASQGKAGGPVAKPVATGQKEKIGEWDAEIYTWEGPMGKGRFWVAKDFPKHAEISAITDKLGKVMGGSMSSMSPQSSDFDGMVVKSEMSIMGKSVVTSLVSAKEETLAASEFTPPADYQEMKIPGAP